MSRNSFNEVKVDVVRSDGVVLPKYESAGAVCCDIKAWLPGGDIVIFPGSSALIKSGLKVSIPDGYEIQIRSRSGLALKHGVFVLNSPGTIDCDYRGDVGVILMNAGPSPFKVSNGDRIAQMSIHKVNYIVWNQVKELDATDRDIGGFGHTGVK